ncbi:MAG: Similar to F420-dependent glucose-6-phosphate dehydrogenase, SCO7290 family, partial [uncultured Thermomicrobiales bacterium]
GRDRLHDDVRAALAQGPGAGCRPRGAGGVRLLGDLRPLPPLARGAGARRLRLVDPRRGRAGDGPDPADDLRHRADHPLPPRDRRPEGGDDGAPRRGPLPARPRRRGAAQRARRRPRLPARRRPPRDAHRGGRDHPAALRRRLRDLPRQALRGRGCEALRPPGDPGADRDRGQRQAVVRHCRQVRRPGDRHRAQARDHRDVPSGGRPWEAGGRADPRLLGAGRGAVPGPGAGAVRLGRRRLEDPGGAAEPGQLRGLHQGRPRGGHRRDGPLRAERGQDRRGGQAVRRRRVRRGRARPDRPEPGRVLRLLRPRARPHPQGAL